MISERRTWQQARANAKQRGIPFELTFDEFVSWWLCELGPNWQSLRGRERDQFQMARFGDAGAYVLGNIKCVTCAQNCAEQQVIFGRQTFLGRKHTEATKAKMSANNKRTNLGRQTPESVKAKLSLAQKGRVFTEEHRERLRQAGQRPEVIARRLAAIQKNKDSACQGPNSK